MEKIKTLEQLKIYMHSGNFRESEFVWREIEAIEQKINELIDYLNDKIEYNHPSKK